jgi:hypothetical protein
MSPQFPVVLKAIYELLAHTAEPQLVSLRLVTVISTGKKGELKVFETARLVVFISSAAPFPF